MKDLTISLIIPAYNEEKYIGECLDYVFKNSDNKFLEIIVVDNASTDLTRKIAEKYTGVKVIREDRKGLTRARECGRRIAQGDILAYIDADTRMPEGWVNIIEKEFDRNNDLVCLSGPYIYYDISKWNGFLVKIWGIFTILIYWIIGYVVTGGNFAIKKEIIDKMSGFDTSIEFYGEDTNIARRAHKFGKVKFKTNFFIYTSARRFKDQGIMKTGYKYLTNFFSEVFYHKPVTQKYKDSR